MNMPLNIDWQQILLHLLNFVVLFAILYFLLYKPVKDFMENRILQYRKMDDEAKENLQKSEELKAAYAEKLRGVDSEIEEKRQSAYKALADETAEALKQAETQAAGIVAQAYEKAEHEHDKIVKKAQDEIADMVTDAAKKIVANANTSEAYDNFLNTVKRGEADA